MRSFLTSNSSVCHNILLPGPHGPFQLLLNDNRDILRLAGHSKYETTYRFYLQVKDGLMDRARKATRHSVSPELLQKCCSGVSGGRKTKGCQT